MAIADRIEEMYTHVGDVYDTIRNVELPEDKNIENIPRTIKDSYLEMINNGTQQVWDNWDKVNGTGTTLTLNNTEEAPMTIALKGNTSQEGTPTPDAPVDVSVVSGDNEIKVEGKNLFNDILRQGVTDYQTNVYNANNSTRITGTNWTILKAGTYTISGTTSLSKTLRESAIIFDTNDNFYNISNVSGVWHNLPYTFTTPIDIKIKLNMSYSDNSNITVSEVSNVMIEKGNQVTTYEEYKGASYPISLGIENLYSSIDRQQTRYGLTCSIMNNRVSISGFASDISFLGTYFNVAGTEDANANYYNYDTRMSGITLKAGTYTISTTNYTGSYETTGNIYLRITKTYSGSYPNTTLATITMNNANSTTFTLSEETTIKILLQVDVLSGTTVNMNNYSFDIELAEGTNRISTTPIELCKIVDYQDRIYKDSGKWYVKKEIGKYTFTGTEEWNSYSWNGITIFRTLFSSIKSSSQQYILSNYFTPVGPDDAIADGNIKNKYVNYYNLECVYSAKTLEEFKTWLSQNTVYLYYILATPTYTLIEDSTLIEELESIKKSYENQTNISQVNNDMPFELNAEALKGDE